jgi:predicted ATPase
MPALDAINVEGYKSIRSAEVELGAINVLIGANGSGKSNLLGLFGLIADLADGRLQLHIGRQGGADSILHFGSKKTSSLRIRLRFGQYEYEAILGPAAGDTLIFEKDSAHSPPLSASGVANGPDRLPLITQTVSSGGAGTKETGLREESFRGDRLLSASIISAMRASRPFHFHDTGRSAPTKRKHKIDDNRVLRAEGDNLAPFLFALRTVATGSYKRIVEAVRSVAPFFDDFILAPDTLNPDVIQLTWRHKTDDALFTADALSDGTLRFICLATLLLQPDLPSLIVIDEPELGLHPFAISQLAALIRAAASKTQILLATQSVTLLDQFEASDVIIAERSNGESTFRRLDDSALTAWKEEYSLGELWLKNVLGGRPR